MDRELCCRIILWIYLLSLCAVENVHSQVGLQPSQFNLATGRKVSATATCGEGHGYPEMYCKLTGANLERGDQQQRVGHEKYFIIQGQICDYCDPTSSDQSHPAENAIDGTERWWQSPPLSRGGQFMEVNLTIDFGQEFHVAYILVTMGNSPRPELWTLERSIDYGKTWTAWQHFADPPSDCETYFGVEPDQPLLADDQVLCTSKFSRLVPLEGGEIVVSLVNDRPGRDNFLASMVLQNWTKATNVRFNFRRMKTLMGHSTGVARQDQTVTRRYYYSVRDISIGGLCVCNGHASSCGMQNPNEPYRQTCKCEHNTCGPYCDRCCPGFVQKKWQPAMHNSSNACEACNCHGHSGDCEYSPDVDEKHLSLDTYGNYEGGGVCRNCEDNTEGINCDKCRAGYFRPYGRSKDDQDACQICRCDARFSTGNCAEGTGICECKPNFTGTNCDRCNNGYYDYPKCPACECNFNGTFNQLCHPDGGNCPCKANFAGPRCDECAANFYDFPNCTACDCEGRGTVPGTSCERLTGQCVCNSGFGGRRCDSCGDGFFNHPTCTPCNCDSAGTEKEICDKSNGRCLCKVGHTGARCDQSAPGFFNYPQVMKCDCHGAGSLNDVCDSYSGRCPCKNNFSGRACDMCAAGYYKFPECLACNCDTYGTIGTTCDNRGQCQCKKNFVGKGCNQCGEGFYNYPLCEGCNCNPAGLITSFGGCGKVQGELCQCKERVTGRICDQCKPGYWGLDLYNPSGCDECSCNANGTVSALSICEGRSGACPCKTNVESRQCTRCKDGFFNLEGNDIHGCRSCGCDVGGAVSPVCDKRTGQCACRPRINGKNCSQALNLHYFPTLHHLKFEAEDGRAKENGPVQYEFKEQDFPEHSWRGYAVMSPRQQEIHIPVQIRKSSLYRMVVRYVNLANTTARADISVSPESNGETEQKAHVDFAPTREGKYVSVGEGTHVNTFVLHPGQWQVTLKSTKPVLVDYIVLLPQAYYEATLLQQGVYEPCLYGQSQLCRNFTYPNLDNFIKVDPMSTQSFYQKNGDQMNPQIDDSSRKGVKGVLIDQSQPELTIIAEVLPAEPHHLVLSYFTRPTNTIKGLKVTFADRNGTVAPGQYKAALYNCPHDLLCRSVIVDGQGRPAVFSPTDRYGKIVISPVGVNGHQPDFVLADLTAVPVTEWHDDYVRPQSGCVLVNGVCQPTDFPTVPDANLVEAESDTQISQMRPEIAGLAAKVQTAMLYLTNQTSYLRGTTQRPGDHVLIVHYYQPAGPGSHLEAAVSGQEQTPAVVDTHFCPSASGCRSVIRQAEGTSRFFRLGKDYSVTIKGSDGNEIYLDYVVAVPSDKFEERYLQESARDLASDFIEQCGKDYFDIDPAAQGFCRKATFSLASGFNNEAFYCDCTIEGSNSFQCEEMGGQCNCKANIIGRKCTRCKSGYWGFPECKVCTCPFNSVCDPVTGRCICPPKVQGDRCDQCMPRTYGFHPITGCQECNCNAYGTSGQLDCEQESGKCVCKANVGGRTCDKCITGHYSFPHCQACHYCDVRGATEAICDQQHGQCICKENVAGPRCDMCKPATFLLDTSNPLGCTKCFCFGITDQCQPSMLHRTMIPQDFQTELSKWATLPSFPVTVKSTGAEATVGTLATPNQEIYWVAPESYLGNRVTSYGGKLSYSVVVTADGAGAGSILPDVVLKGRNITVVYLHDRQPVAGANHEVEVEITEANFEHESGNKVTRDQLMLVLVNLDALHIKAGYFPSPKVVTLVFATLEGAVRPMEVNEVVVGARNDAATKVEECNCPLQYSGTSCENCAALHYRSQAGPFLGTCLPCECNGHAERCDPVTGQCINCLHNTTGERCDQCVEGFHGDATRGSPHDCMICACPRPLASNNFATACRVENNGHDLSCDCRPGYAGDRCQYCAAGYFGHPDVPGDYCRPCQCNGHIDPNDYESCDPLTGECRKCLNNTSGPQCNVCRDDYFGDPTTGSCQACACDQYGTEDCNTTSGTCKCYPNVEGIRCDRCTPGHWDFESGKGCSRCGCGLASISQQCNNENGQCICQPGVTGKHCDQCAHGYWNYTAAGCTRCACATKYSVGEMCNQQTGHCSCLPGVTGQDCDRCKPRHVLVENVGCEACGYCVHTLLDDFDEMNQRIDAADREFERVSASQFAVIRQNRVAETISNLTQAVNFLTQTGAPQTLLGFDSDLGRIEMAVDKKIKQVTDAKTTAEDRLTAADRARDELTGILRSIGGATKNVTDLAANIVQLDNYLRQGPGSKVTESQVVAEPILLTLKNRKFSDYHSNSTFEFNVAKETQGLVHKFQGMYNATQNKSESVQKSVRDFREKMKDLEKHSVAASETVTEAKVTTERVQANISDNVDAIHFLLKLIKDLQANTTREAEKSKLYFTDAQTAFGTLDDQSGKLKTVRDQLEAQNRAHQQDNRESQAVITSARDHVSLLDHEADRLDRLFTPTRSAAADGKKAANAYGNIVQAVNEASQANANSTRLADEVASTSESNRGRGAESLQISQGLNSQADQSKIDALQLRGSLETSRNKGQAVKDRHAQTEQVIAEVRSGLSQIPRQDVTAQAAALNGRARAAHDKAAAVLAKAEEIKAQLTGGASPLTGRPDAATTQVAMHEIFLAESAARAVPEELPLYNEKINRVTAGIARTDALAVDLGNKIEELRKKVELTRSLVNRVGMGKTQMGVQIARDNSIRLKNPAEISRASTYTHISLFFKTAERDGLLFYLGNEVGTSRRTKRDFSPITDDYMALEIQNGLAVLLYDLGSGHTRIEVRDRYVSDNHWHQAIVERIGKLATVTIRSERAADGSRRDATAEGSLEGPNTVFNLNQENSTFFIAGMPLTFRLQTPVKNKRFAGFIEGLEFDMEPIGLWNHGNVTYDATAPAVPKLAKARDQLLEKPVEDGIKLDGVGYAVFNMEGRTDVSRDTAVIFELKTFDKEGLVFLLSEQNSQDFLSLELRDGRVTFQYDLGSGVVTIQSSDRYDDGKWHTISAVRGGRRGVLQIDAISVANDTSPGHEDKLDVSRAMLIGGHKVVSHAGVVTGDGFEGCIRLVEVAKRRIKLEDSREAKGTVLGCPATIRRLVSFDEKTVGGYLAMPAVNVESQFQITLKFKTVNPDGLLFLTAGEDNKQIFSLSLQSGKLVLASDDGRSPVTMLSTDLSGYWNGDWHYVSASKEANRLRLMIDDFETVQTAERHGDPLYTTKPLYFGGVPDTVTTASTALPQTRNFIGCIGDVVVNDVVQNFAISQEKNGASFASCLVAAVPGQELPVLPPQPTSATLPPFHLQPAQTTIKVGVITYSPVAVTVEATKATAATPATPATVATTVPTTTTTTEEPVTTAYYHRPDWKECALPLHPETDTSLGSQSSALQYGSRPESRLEFSASPANYAKDGEFSVEFKTNSTDGIILYVDDQKANPIDFIALYVKAGQVVYSFNPGSGAAVVRSPLKYNDGQWHTLAAVKQRRVGKLLLDGVEVQAAESPAGTEVLNTNFPLYLGGVNGNRNASKNTEGVRLPFNGCLRNLKFNGAPFGDPSSTVAVGPCSEKTEPGAFFYADGGHLALRGEKFRVGATMEISIEIRPRSNNGVILAVGTSNRRRDFLALQLINGVVHFSFDNGGGVAQINVTLPNQFSICDGGWHSIKAVKSTFVATLEVDGKSDASVGPTGQSTADTDLPLFVGSWPNSMANVKTIIRKQYVGCVRNLQIDNKLENFASGKAVGQVLSNACPIR